MKHFVFRKVLFTIGKDWEDNTDTLKMIYVDCQWQNSRKEQCDISILVCADRIEKALEGDPVERESIFDLFAYNLMLDFKPFVIS